MPDIEEFYGQPNMNDKKTSSKAKVSSVSIDLFQDGDCCGGNDVQVLNISSDDGGGGWFWTIKTDRWAFDSLDDLINQLKPIIEKLGTLEEK